MKNSCIFSIIFYLIILNCLNLFARDENQSQVSFSVWPTYQNSPDAHFQAHAQINRVEKDFYNFNTPQNSGNVSFSGQDWYQQHRQFFLSNVVCISLQSQVIKITPEDINLINRICADNPHKNKNELRMQLAQSSAFNYAQYFLKGDKELDAFTPDIYINPDHFKAVSVHKYRIAKLEKAAKNAIENRYEKEKSKLQANSKNKPQNTKSLKAVLDAEYKRQKKHFLGDKKYVENLIDATKNLAALNTIAPVVKKSNVNLQEIEKLQKNNDNQISKVACHQDSSYQQVMDKRSKAFENSINNPTSTIAHININNQTRVFLQAQGVDVNQFQQIEGLPIQHQLTHELIDVLDTVADYVQQHQHTISHIDLIKHCANLASLSQQSNAQGAVQQAIDCTNCCHGITHYLQGMVSGVGQAYQQFQTALHYLQPTLEEYALIIEQHALQGIAAVSVVEAIITAGLIAAPATTVAVTGIMIGVTAYVMAPLCVQAMVDTVSFGESYIMGDWDKVVRDLDNFGRFISSPETVARIAELAGGAAIATPNLSCVVEQILSLRPVITSVQNASGDMVQSLYLMTKNQLQKVYTQGVELLQLPEFVNFNMSYKKICGFNFFDILPKAHPALVGIEANLLSSGEQIALTYLCTQAEGLVGNEIVKSGVSSLGSQAAQITEQAMKSLIAEQVYSVTELHEIVKYKIDEISKEPIVSIDLTAKITDAKHVELRELAPQIRQLQDLAKHTENFKNIENLIPEDIYYLNRIYELQPYRAQIKKFLDTHKLYFMHENEKYFIEDIASYHIHAGDYFRKNLPRGGHSNFNGSKLNHFKPTVNKHGPLGTKDLIFHNSRNVNLTKKSAIYPKAWSEFVCDLKAIEVMMSENIKILKSSSIGSEIFKITGTTKEGLDLIIYYDIAHKRIKSHYPDLENF